MPQSLVGNPTCVYVRHITATDAALTLTRINRLQMRGRACQCAMSLTVTPQCSQSIRVRACVMCQSYVAFRLFIASQSSGVDKGLVYRPALDFPTSSFAAVRKAELKRWTLSWSDIGVGENSSIASSMAAENAFQSTLLVFQRAL